MTAEFRETASQFRLKDHDQGDGQKNRKTPDQPPDHDEIQQRRYQGEGQKDNREAGEHLGAAGSAKVKVAVIDTYAQKDDFENASPARDPELGNLMKH